MSIFFKMMLNAHPYISIRQCHQQTFGKQSSNVVNHLSNNNHLSYKQIRSSRSTFDVLIAIMYRIIEAVNKSILRAFALDITKAFDELEHEKMLQKKVPS